MYKKITKIGFAVLMIMSCLGLKTIVQAEEDSEGGFSFEVIRPENQKNSEVTYFDLLMTPNQKQTVQIKLNNTSDKERKISLKLNSAKTNSNGVIEYGPSQIKEDASVKYKFTDLVKAPEEVTLAPQSSQLVDINISMPESSIEGYISGGIQLQDITDGGKESQTDQGMVINKFAYLIGFLLSESDTEGLKPDLKFNKVYPGLKNYSNSILVNFSNITPVYVEEMTVDVQIMKKNSDEVIYDSKKSNMRMAPNTLIDFPVSLNGDRMVAGEYRAKILVTSKDNGRWLWEEAFKITDGEADKFNEQDLSLVQDKGINWLLIIGIVVSMLVVLVLIYLIIRFLRKKKEEKEKAARKEQQKKRKQPSKK